MRLLNLLCPVALVAATVGGAQAAGSDAPAGAAASADFRALVTYYQGHWQCRGHFANGTTISSDEQFDPWLDGKWLHELHDDQPPFSYHAHSVWGVAEPNGALTLTI
jgi:hypothetical protein